ncbi:hypothetical protein AAVH_08273 [Aphelenchoides avenae]|nr:hypothetical protein AAVH_08273 [Aphelenchus avenae]
MEERDASRWLRRMGLFVEGKRAADAEEFRTGLGDAPPRGELRPSSAALRMRVVCPRINGGFEACASED